MSSCFNCLILETLKSGGQSQEKWYEEVKLSMANHPVMQISLTAMTVH